MSQQRENQRGTVSQTTTTTASPILKLRAQERQARDVSWDANVVDNEHLNKKRQKYAVYFIHQIGTVMKKIVQVPVTRLVILQIMKRMIKTGRYPRNLTITKKSKPNAYEVQPHYKTNQRCPENEIFS